ncbi:hypothetical protein HDV00_005472 [Rhizophlyctis rosea]|nr:hypothetical protein HDV00_005472 [Rhizophlyctis rosea]
MSIQIHLLPGPDRPSPFFGVPNTPTFGIDALVRVKNTSPTKHKNIHHGTFLLQGLVKTHVKHSRTDYYRDGTVVNTIWTLVEEPDAAQGKTPFVQSSATGTSTIPPIPPNSHVDLPVHINLGSDTSPYLPNSGVMLAGTGSFSTHYSFTVEILVPQKSNKPKSVKKRFPFNVKSGIYPTIPLPLEGGWKNSEPFNMTQGGGDRLRTPKDCPFNLDFTLPNGLCVQIGVPFTVNFRIIPIALDISKVKSLSVRIKQYRVVWSGHGTGAGGSALGGGGKGMTSDPVLTHEFLPSNAQGGSFAHPQVWNLTVNAQQKKTFGGVILLESMEVTNMAKVYHELKVEMVVSGDKKKEYLFQTEVRIVRPPTDPVGGASM